MATVTITLTDEEDDHLNIEVDFNPPVTVESSDSIAVYYARLFLELVAKDSNQQQEMMEQIEAQALSD